MRLSLEPDLERQAVDPGVAAGMAQLHRLALVGPQDRPHALDHHHAADRAEQKHVGNADGDVELADRAQQREQPHPRHGADDAAGQQHQGEREVERAAAPIGDRAGHGGSRDVARYRRDRHRRRYPDEDQQRRHQEAAADAEHAGNEPDREPHREHEEYIDRKVGDREVNFHGLDPTVRGGENFVLAGGSLRAKRPDQPVSPCRANASFFCPPEGRSIVSLPDGVAQRVARSRMKRAGQASPIPLALHPGCALAAPIVRSRSSGTRDLFCGQR